MAIELARGCWAAGISSRVADVFHMCLPFTLPLQWRPPLVPLSSLRSVADRPHTVPSLVGHAENMRVTVRIDTRAPFPMQWWHQGARNALFNRVRRVRFRWATVPAPDGPPVGPLGAGHARTAISAVESIWAEALCTVPVQLYQRAHVGGRGCGMG